MDHFFIFKYIAEFDDIFGPMSRRGISPTFKTQFKKGHLKLNLFIPADDFLKK